jgi:hypothetical protein
VPDIAILSNHPSDSLYISGAATLCQMSAAQCRTASELLENTKSETKSIIFVEMESGQFPDLVEALSGKSRNTDDRKVIVVMIVPEAFDSMEQIDLRDCVNAVLRRPLNMKEVIGVLQGFQAI